MKKLLISAVLTWITALALPSNCSQAVGGQPPAHSDIQSKPVISIWPGKAPGSEDWSFRERVAEGPDGSKIYSNVVNPTLTGYLPDPAKTNGAAVILCPGGAMRMLGFAETERAAEWLNARGIAAFILKYRVVPDTASDGPSRTAFQGMGNELSLKEILNRRGNANPAPDDSMQLKVIAMAISDGQQAIRVLRRDAAKSHIDPERIGILGFSAGGGVAIGTAVLESSDAYPDFVDTIYGPSLVDVTVPKLGTPLFIAVMDGHFNVTNGCMALFTLWKEAGRPVEMHVYDHAYGPASGMPVVSWIDRLCDWLRARKLID